MLEVDQLSHTKQVTIARGQQLVVRLPENPTTGYRWTIEAQAGLSLATDQTLPAGQSPGAGATRVFTFSANAAGTAQLELTLRRAWEPSAAAIEHFSLTVACM